MSSIDDWGPGKQIDPGGIGVVARGGAEVGLVLAELNTTTEASGGFTWTVVTEHWWLYPTWTPLTRQAPTMTVSWKSPYDVSGSEVVTLANAEAYVRGRCGGTLAGVHYERITSRRRTL